MCRIVTKALEINEWEIEQQPPNVDDPVCCLPLLLMAGWLVTSNVRAAVVDRISFDLLWRCKHLNQRVLLSRHTHQNIKLLLIYTLVSCIIKCEV